MPVLKRLERFEAKPYQDVNGVWTIGYGTTYYPNGTHVQQGDPAIDEHTATSYMYDAASKTNAVIGRSFKRTPTDGQRAAMVCLAYNIGTMRFLGSHVLAYFNEGDMKAACDAFRMWDKPPSILGRRTIEQGMFNG